MACAPASIIYATTQSAVLYTAVVQYTTFSQGPPVRGIATTTNALGLPVTFVTAVTPDPVPVTGQSLTTGFSTVIASSPISTVAASCATASSIVPVAPSSSIVLPSVVTPTRSSRVTLATSTPTTAATSASVEVSTTFSTITPGQSRSSSSPTSSVTSGASTGGSSSTPVGAIAGGVIGGLAVLILGAVLLWYCGRRKSGHRDQDFVFTEDAWDPAAGVASGAAANNVGNRRSASNNRYSEMAGGGARGGARGGAPPAMAMAERRTNSSASRRKPTPANEQDMYYSNAPPPPPSSGGHDHDGAGFAGVGALGRAMSRPDANSETPYGGLDESLQPSGTEGGYAIASQMIHRNSQQRLTSQNSPQGSPRIPAPAMMGGRGGQHHPPMSIPYIPASNTTNGNNSHSSSSLLPFSTPLLGAQSPERGNRVTPPSVSDGGWSRNPEEEVRGPLRVTNDQGDASDSEVLSAPWHDPNQGSAGGAYSRESLTAGLTYGSGPATRRGPA